MPQERLNSIQVNDAGDLLDALTSLVNTAKDHAADLRREFQGGFFKYEVSARFGATPLSGDNVTRATVYAEALTDGSVVYNIELS